jgi:hypothetical protein
MCPGIKDPYEAGMTWGNTSLAPVGTTSLVGTWGNGSALYCTFKFPLSNLELLFYMHAPNVPALPFHQMYKGLNQKNRGRVHVGFQLSSTHWFRLERNFFTYPKILHIVSSLWAEPTKSFKSRLPTIMHLNSIHFEWSAYMSASALSKCNYTSTCMQSLTPTKVKEPCCTPSSMLLHLST